MGFLIWYLRVCTFGMHTTNCPWARVWVLLKASWCLWTLGWGWHRGRHAPCIEPGKGPDFHVFAWKGVPQELGWSLSRVSIHHNGGLMGDEHPAALRAGGYLWFPS